MRASGQPAIAAEGDGAKLGATVSRPDQQVRGGRHGLRQAVGGAPSVISLFLLDRGLDMGARGFALLTIDAYAAVRIGKNSQHPAADVGICDRGVVQVEADMERLADRDCHLA